MSQAHVEDFWLRCRRALPALQAGSRYTLRRMGNAPEISEMLLGLVGSGEKTGLFSRPEELRAAGVAPAAGDLVVFTDFSGRPRCLVRMEECAELRFGDIGPEHTACESPAARDVAVWRDIHRRYWGPAVAAEGATFTDDLPVLFQRFRLLYVEPPAARA